MGRDSGAGFEAGWSRPRALWARGRTRGTVRLGPWFPEGLVSGAHRAPSGFRAGARGWLVSAGSAAVGGSVPLPPFLVAARAWAPRGRGDGTDGDATAEHF